MSGRKKIGTNDVDIRLALRAKRLRRFMSCPETLVVDELGLAHAQCRIDVAVINGCLHGYEIKSSKDNLDRLPMQISVYRKALQKITIVAATRHITRVECVVPSWCGIIEAQQGPRGGINFQTLRRANYSPDTDPIVLAHLLWRSEAVRILESLGFGATSLKGSRKDLYKLLCSKLTTQEILYSIKHSMKARQTWRGHQAHGLCDG